MATNYAVRLRCPHGDHDEWLTLRDREETIEKILHQPWDFECPIHGVLREMPIDAHEESPAAAAKRLYDPQVQRKPAVESADRVAQKTHKPRASDRLPLHVAVVLYGWSKALGSFQEETTTLLVNAGGALLTLQTQIALGENAFLINKATREEQEVQIVYVEPMEGGRILAGVALKRPSSLFWKRTRRNPRIPRNVRVIVKGKDRNGNPFVQSSYTVDISREGARLDGLGYLTGPGDTIEVKRPWRGKARYRVIWIGQVGLDQSNQIGVSSLEQDKDLWGDRLLESDESKSGEEKNPAEK